jgi:hypothetical protein
VPYAGEIEPSASSDVDVDRHHFLVDAVRLGGDFACQQKLS